MRVAALYDIHGNLPALEAVLRDVGAESVDVVQVGGDVVWGPWPGEVLDLLQGLPGARFIRGNADREVAAGDGADLDGVTGEVTAWVASRLTAEQKQSLMGWPSTSEYEVEGVGGVLFCHGSPRSDEEMLTRLSPLDRLEAALAGVAQRTVVCGHTHVQFRRPAGNHQVVNAGSIGMPYEGRRGAYWAVLGPGVHLRRTEYDVDDAARAMEATDCPYVREVFVDTLLSPPSPEDAAREFESIARHKTY